MLSDVKLEPWHFAALQLIDDFFVKTRNDPPQAQVRADASGIREMFKILRSGKKSR